MKKAELVIVPTVGISHLVPTIELAKRLIARDDRFSVTVLIMPEIRNTTSTSTPTPIPTTSFLHSVPPAIHFIDIPLPELPQTQEGRDFLPVAESFKPLVSDALTKLINDSTVPVVGMVVDMFTTTMIDVANEFSIPSYLYFTSAAAMLCFMLHLPTLDKTIPTDFIDYPGDIVIPGYGNPVSTLAFPSMLLHKTDQGYKFLMYHARKFKEAKGFIVNSVSELEPKAFGSLSADVPKVYPVGPLLDLDSPSENKGEQHQKIIKWLDNQPASSVVFLCFGSRGAFSEPQVKNIAAGLERSGQRFLWSLRQPSPGFEEPTDYTNLDDVLPEGFLGRTKDVGLICGWAPQVEVLAHEAVGGFVSHCGWNSILESLWFGVPILGWPLYAEQKLNCFELSKHLELAFEIKTDFDDRVTFPEEIERGVNRLMDRDSQVRRNVRDMKEYCRKALVENGSSFNSMGCLINDFTGEGPVHV